MRFNWLAPGIALSAVLFGALQLSAQVVVGPNSKGGFNAYTRDAATKPFGTAESDASSLKFPGYIVNGVEVLPASSVKGHLVTLQGVQEANFVVNSVGTGWLGLSDDPAYGGEEFDNTSGMPMPPLKSGSKELREIPKDGERGAGWVWTTGEPFDYQSWNGGEPNNSGGAENSAELIAGGLYNDLSTQEIPSLIEWDLKLAQHPISMELDLGAINGKLAGRVVATTTEGGKAIPGENFTVAQKVSYTLKEPGVSPQAGGLTSTWLNGNLTSDAAWDAGLANPASYIVSPFLLDKISYGNGTPNGYPAATGLTGNVDNYSVQWQGEIFIPKGSINFRDGNDDYAKLVIDGNTLIDDNTWTSWDGTQNGGGGVGTFDATKSDVTVDGLKGGWYPITFRGAEGGGGDNFRLVWDATDKGISAPDDVAFANPDTAGEFFTVGSEFFRSTDPGIKVSATIPLGFVSAGGVAGYAGNDGLGSAGTNAEIPLNGATISLSGQQTLVLTASVGGLTQTLEKVVDFGGTGPGTPPGDLNGDHKVDLSDFGILKANFGKSGAAGAAVPEPSTLLLAGLGLLGLAVRWARRRFN
jgi:hypothetical protein